MNESVYEVEHPVWGSNIATQIVVDIDKTDDDMTYRQFNHRCGLLKIIVAKLKDQLVFSILFDGHVTSEFSPNEVSFRFVPDELKDNDGNPIADLWFSAYGKRRGPFMQYHPYRAICTFADRKQMNKCLIVAEKITW